MSDDIYSREKQYIVDRGIDPTAVIMMLYERVYVLQPKDMNRLLNMWELHNGSDPSGKFLSIENGVYTACDNDCGECFMEDFSDFELAIQYLLGEPEPIEDMIAEFSKNTWSWPL